MPAADVTNLGSFAFYTGMVGFTLDTAAPPGWVLLETGGSTALIADHPSLAQLLGTRYGGDGVTTFGLPPAEYVLAGPTSLHPLWTFFGEEEHTLTDAEMQHHHPLPTVNEFPQGSTTIAATSVTGPVVLDSPSAHNNLQPTHRVNVIVKD